MDIILKYFPGLSPEQQRQIAMLGPLYTEWNERINVISRKDIEHLYERHVLHSLAIAKGLVFAPGSKILDIGTGGGFPGIPLAILMPEVQFTLVDGVGKKITVVNAVIEALGLKNARGIHTRSENLRESFDFVVSRAVTNLPAFLPMTQNRIAKKMRNAFPNGIWYLKGGDFDEELRATGRTYEVTPLSQWFDEPFFETKKLVYLSAG